MSLLSAMPLLLLVVFSYQVALCLAEPHSFKGLCVFDVDKTLTRGGDAVASECCQNDDCLSNDPYTTYCSGEHPAPIRDDTNRERFYDCRPSCHCGEPGCEFQGQCPFFNSTWINHGVEMGGNMGTNCKNTLTPDGRTRLRPAAYAREAVQACIDAGMAVAVATAELYDPARANRDFLQSLSIAAFPDTFFDALNCEGPQPCSGHLLQWGEPFSPTGGKPREMRNLVEMLANDSFKLPANCMIFFDDEPRNAWSAVAQGAHAQRASTNCDGDTYLCCNACGLTKDNFEKGMYRLRNGYEYAAKDFKTGTNETVKIEPCPSFTTTVVV